MKKREINSLKDVTKQQIIKQTFRFNKSNKHNNF